MICPQCSRENAANASRCVQCGALLAERTGPPRVSRLAIASLISSLTCIGSLLGLILGIIALRQISRRRDDLTGQGVAIAGICIAGAAMLFAFPIMAAMLFPVFARARETARKVQCLSNVKNLAMAVQMYATEYGAYPGASGQWCDQLRPYVGGDQVYVCPSEPDLRSGYAYWGALKGAKVEQVPAPESQLAIFESPKGWNTYGDLSVMGVAPRHLRGDNYGFADGHAQWVAGETAQSGNWPPAFTNPEPLKTKGP